MLRWRGLLSVSCFIAATAALSVPRSLRDSPAIDPSHVAGPRDRVTISTPDASDESLKIDIRNNRNAVMYAYVSGKASGQIGFVHVANGSVPLSWAQLREQNLDEQGWILDMQRLSIRLEANSPTAFYLPDYVSSGRIYICDSPEIEFGRTANGDFREPSFVNPSSDAYKHRCGFIEFDYSSSSLWANLSFVDFVGLVLSMTVTTKSDKEISSPGLEGDALQGICDDMEAQSEKDGQDWGAMCLRDDSDEILRVIAPNMFIQTPHLFLPPGQNTTMSEYYKEYVDKVWEKYRTELLTIDTQAKGVPVPNKGGPADPNEGGKADPNNGSNRVKCGVEGDSLICDPQGEKHSFARPTTGDILGCNSGPFANNVSTMPVSRLRIVPLLCAAFTRSTLLLENGNVQPAPGMDQFYKEDPTNHYARIVHGHLKGSLKAGYTFAYDDANSAGEDVSGLLNVADPESLTIMIGG
ncbi:hypothetical protein DL764_006142 [Monosporascus ibericus]|uniref:GH64 domain-containing protein n=1 Tax=Monosporascus ibericus TaxID=155417 RepID=A0A4V1XA66_9PEZI|nr:hypothetical protein DL764_006142 [Monosporascus ibericus]